MRVSQGDGAVGECVPRLILGWAGSEGEGGANVLTNSAHCAGTTCAWPAVLMGAGEREREWTMLQLRDAISAAGAVELSLS